MKLRVYTDDAFELVLIKTSSLQNIFCTRDLAMRQNSEQPIVDKYHENWIHENTILVPSFHINNEKAFVGMGRHRFTMLSRHMETIPAAFERSFSDSDRLDEILRQIVIRKLFQYEEIDYPNLPIEYLGDDVNGLPNWKNHLE